MTAADVPAVAVQIAAKGLLRGGAVCACRACATGVVAALAAAGWLHDPAEVAALRAVADAARKVSFHGEPGDLHRLWESAVALDAVGSGVK